jgi:4'-phosphopantetheinyl transferase
VWRVDLEAVTDDLGELLCGEERARAERFVSESDRRRWTRSRGVLRTLLGRYLQKDPGTLRFATGAHGKPELLGDAMGSTAASEPGSVRTPRLCFNLSHSRQLALYAFTETGAVGVDVEVARRSIDEIAIAARVFGPGEARRLQGLDPEIRQGEFLRAWTRHEAELKCHGTGIGGAAAVASGHGPWIAELDVGPRAAAAVAVQEPPRELRLEDLHSDRLGDRLATHHDGEHR